MKTMPLEAGFDADGEKIKLPSLFRWTGTTAIGYALGMTLSTYLVSEAVRPLGPLFWGILNVLIYGAVIGATTGACQLAAMPRGLVSIPGWLLASLAGTAVGFAVASVASEAISNSWDPAKNIVLSFGIAAVAAGGIIGFASGLGQWQALRVRLPGLQGWIRGSILGAILGTLMATTLLGLFDWPLLNAAPSTSVGAILGVVAGIFQGLVFRSQRRQFKR